MFYVESQSSRLIGWFPTKELAEQHCRDWPDEGMSVIPGCYITGVVERFPPRMMTEETTKALNDHNANVARMVSHGDDAFRYKPQEPETVDLEMKVPKEMINPEILAKLRVIIDKAEFWKGTKDADDYNVAADHVVIEIVEALNGPDDGRPCAMDKFVADLHEATDDAFERDEAITHWLYGDWDEAMAYLKDEDADEPGEHQEVLDAIDACNSGDDE